MVTTRAPRTRSTAHLVGFSVAYLLAHRLGYRFVDPQTHFATIWPANGVALAALLLAPAGSTRPLLAVLTGLAAVSSVAGGHPPFAVAGFGLANLVEIALAYTLVCRFARRELDFTRVADASSLIVASILASGASGLIGAAIANRLSGRPFTQCFAHWWVPDMLGLLVVTPVLVTWLRGAPRPRAFTRARALEAAAFVAAWASATWVAFAPSAPDVPIAQPYVLLALLPWPAIRLGVRSVTAAVFGLAAVVLNPSIVPLSHAGMGAIGPTEPILALQLYLTVASISGLLLTASVRQTRIAEAKARENHERLGFLSDNIPDGTLYQVVRELDGRMRFTYISSALERLHGISVEAALADPSLVYSRARPEDRERVAAAENRSFRTGEPFDEILQVPTPSGELRWKRITSMPRRLPDGRTVWDGLETDITEQRRAQEEARRNAEHLELALQSARMGTWAWNSADQRLELSEDALRILGVTPGHEVRHAADLAALTHPDDRDALAATLAAIVSGDRDQWADAVRIVRDDGSIRWVEGRGRLHRDAHGATTGAAGVIADITERKATEAHLARANRALRTLSHCTRAVAHATDEKALLDDVCRGISEVGGYPLAWVGIAESDDERAVRVVAHHGPGSSYLESAHVTWSDRSSGSGPTGRAIRSGSTAVLNCLGSDPDFEPWRQRALASGFQSSAAFPLQDAVTFGALSVYANEPDAFDGAEIELLAELARDLSHGIQALRDRASRQRAETALATSEARLRSAMESSPIGMAITDVEGRFEYGNPALCRMLGYAADELVGRRVQELIHPDDLAEDLVRVEALLTGKATSYEIEKRYLRADGTIQWVQVSRTLVKGSDGTPPHFLAQVQDITERMRSSEALLKSNARLRLAMDVARIGYWEYDVETDTFEFDDDFYRLLRTTAQREGGNTMPAAEYARRFLPPEWAPAVAIETRAAIETRDPLYRRCIEHPIRRADGSLGVIEVEIRVVKDASGRTIRTFGANQDITERRLAEQALRDSEERLRAAMESSPIGMAIVATDGRLLNVNPALCEILGYTRHELLQLGFQQLTHPDDLSKDVAQVERLLSGEADAYQLDKRYIRADGATIHAQLNVSIVRDDQGQPLHFFSQVQDVTERVRAEAEISESHARLRLVMEIAKLGYWDFDVASGTFTFNDDFYRLFATTASEEGGYTMSAEEYARRFLPADVARELPSYVASALTTSDPHYRGMHEHEIRRRDGSVAVLQVEARIVKDENGRTVRIYGCNQDITERAEAELALRESEDRFRQVVEHIQEVFWLTYLDTGEVLYVSPAYEVVWSRTCASAYEHPEAWIEGIHPDDRERVLQALDRSKHTRRFDEEFRVVRPDGSVRWVHDHGIAVAGERGGRDRMVGVVQDITDRRHFEEQFLQAQKLEAIGRLAGGVAHDFNNILAAMMLLAEDVAIDPDTTSSVRERMADMTHALDRAAGLTRQLLAFSRRQVMRPRPIDVNDVVNDLVKMLRRILGEDIRLHLDLHPAAIVVEADTGMIEQVLMNLAVNARDAMPDGGSLVLETAREVLDESAALAIPEGVAGDYARIRITDTGCGIPPENLEHVFEPFFTTKELGKGTGLGLATVFGIVRQHHGLVRVTSVVNHGTTFDVLLPVMRGEAEIDGPPVAVKANPRGTETVLVVEDDAAVRRVTCLVLERHGYTVIAAESGPAALDALAEHGKRIDLLLTDVVMPEGMTGIELAAQVSLHAPQVKVILTSGYSADLAERASEHRFLQKPCRPHDLLVAVREVLDGR